jgi:aminocarboxymuconate-semialdehyde decarboxylase
MKHCPSDKSRGATTINAQLSARTGYVDVHTHAIDDDLPDLRRSYPHDCWPSIDRTNDTEAHLMFGGQHYRGIDHRCWSPRARLIDMDRKGVGMQVLSPIPVTFCYRASAAGAAELASAQNEFFVRITDAHPTRFAALGAVALQDPDRAVDEMRRCMHHPSFLGVEIGTQVAGTELGDPSLDRFFAVAHELGALVLVHPSDQDLSPRLTGLDLGFGAGMPLETAVPAIIGRLDKGAILAGSPDVPSLLAAQLWCDSLTYHHSALQQAIEVFGGEHVVFGSDYPFPAMPDPIDDILTHLPADLRRGICRTNLEEDYGAISGSGLDSLSAAGRHRRTHGGSAAMDAG